MVNLKDAVSIAKKYLPNGKIRKCVVYKNTYLFMIFSPDPNEGQMDSIYAVDDKTGDFRDFPYMKPGVFDEVMKLFENAPNFTGGD